ncbi:MAG: hypothetical protein GXP19_02765 [Gammaproteobacteria bacterium]|nr:hypothetical protein [Gammaproteobacteria bacterium]
MKQAIILFILFSFCFYPVFANENMTPAELEKWFNEVEPALPIQVDEGKLVFLAQLPDKPLLHSINEITIDANSIDNGWVRLAQCYKNLDPVAKADIVYRYRFMRNLKISSILNIGAARIREQLIELEDVQRKAELCVKAEVRVFYQNPDGSYSLVNGPYHRKYLDGYFPYHVTLVIHYPENQLKHIANQPAEQSGFSLKKEKNKLLIDTVFSGTLNTEIIFGKKNK